VTGRDVTVRAERPADAAAIRKVLVAAFPSDEEAVLVERLRAEGDLVAAFVAENDAKGVVGYIAFSRLTLGPEPGNAQAAVALGVLAVDPGSQRGGVGAALVRAGLGHLAGSAAHLVFVLGDPAYYRRFGFTVDMARGFRSVYSGPHYMALALSPGTPREGTIDYPAAFNALR
jgi:putative acetyltransferase